MYVWPMATCSSTTSQEESRARWPVDGFFDFLPWTGRRGSVPHTQCLQHAPDRPRLHCYGFSLLFFLLRRLLPARYGFSWQPGNRLL